MALSPHTLGKEEQERPVSPGKTVGKWCKFGFVNTEHPCLLFRAVSRAVA